MATNNRHTDVNAVIVVDSIGRIRMVNDACTRMIGATPEYLKGHAVDRLFPETTFLGEIVHAAVTRGEAIEIVVCVGPRYYDVQASPLHDLFAAEAPGPENSDVNHVLLSVEDVTFDQGREQALIDSHRLEVAGTIASGMAHRINNLLAGIQTTAEYLERQPALPEATSRAIRQIKQTVKTASDIAYRTLSYADGGIGHISSAVVDEIVQDVLDRYLPQMAAGVTIETTLGLGLQRVAVDRHQFMEALGNVLRNAEEAVVDTGTIRLSTSVLWCEEPDSRLEPPLARGTYAVITVDDDGIGMDEVTRARAHEPFFSTKQLGRGLGYSATYGIVLSHGGRLRIQSAPGGGTTVTIYLLVEDAGLETDLEAAQEAAHEASGAEPRT